MWLRDKIEHPPRISDLPAWRKILMACAFAFVLFVVGISLDKHLTIYGGSPDHAVDATGQTYSVSVMHGYIRYVTLREYESFRLWGGLGGSWAGGAFVFGFFIWISASRKPTGHAS